MNGKTEETGGAVAYLTRWTDSRGRDAMKIHANAYRARGYAAEIAALSARCRVFAKVRIYAISLVGCVGITSKEQTK